MGGVTEASIAGVVQSLGGGGRAAVMASMWVDATLAAVHARRHCTSHSARGAMAARLKEVARRPPHLQGGCRPRERRCVGGPKSRRSFALSVVAMLRMVGEAEPSAATENAAMHH